MPLTLTPLASSPVRIERRIQLGPHSSAVAAMRQTVKELSLELSRHAAREINTSNEPEVAIAGEASIEGAEGRLDITITVVRRR
jgi:hypothetical protein